MDVDPRRAGRVVLALCLAGVVITSVVLLVAGARKNSQIDALRLRGVPAVMTIGACQGLLGGSGSNPVGYACWGSFREAGRRYTEYLPGTDLHAPGSKVRIVTVADDPALVTTPGMLAGEHASPAVFLLPAVLLGSVALGLAGLGLRRRAQPASRSRPSRLDVGRARLGEAAGGV